MNKGLKEHIRNEYIAGAKKLIIEQGAGSVTARNLAKLTGNSHTMVYSYFNKIDELIWYAGLSLNEDLAKCYDPLVEDRLYTVEDVEVFFVRYLEFQFENPTIFKMFLDQKIDMPPEHIVKEMATPRVRKGVYKVFTVLFESKGRTEEDAILVADLLMASVYGYLAMYLGSIPVITPDEIVEAVKKQIRYLCP